MTTTSLGAVIVALFICAYFVILWIGVTRDRRPDPGGLFWLGLMLALLSVATFEVGGLFLRALLRT